MNRTTTIPNQTLRVLHLEDSRQDRELIHALLEKDGFVMAITNAANRAEFTQALQNHEFDIILSDKSLPAFDGMEALHLAKEHCPDVPFVFITGSLGEEAAIETIKHGATDYVLKDRPQRLKLAIQRALREAEQTRENRRYTETLRESEERLRLISRAGNDVTWDWNIEIGTCTQSEGIRRFGYAEMSQPGERPWLDHAHPDHIERVLKRVQDVLVGQEQFWSDEYPLLRSDGTIAHVFNRGYVVRDTGGRAIRMVGAMMEVSERKEAVEIIQEEEQKKLEAHVLRVQRLESVGALASGVAHDLNNVLAPILVGVPFLKEQTSDPATLKIFDAMEASVARGAGIVKQILTFARGSAGERTQLQPNQFIQEMVKILDETFPKSIRIRSECDPALFEIEADGMQFHQVLLNLCVNARDAMPDGGTLTLSSCNIQLKNPVSCAGLTGPPGDYVQIRITDTGVGMSKELQQKIFQPFFTTKEPGKGTGLGLSTTVRILQGHGALLGLESDLGRGTTFSIYFPAKLVQRKTDVPAAAPPVAQGRQELILLVDDEVAIREMCKLILESLDYRVLTAENGAEALSLLERNKTEISAVIVDMMMPVMDGAAVIRAIRWSAPHLKIVATSGLTDKEQSDAFGGTRPDVFLPKPYTARQLMSALAGLLRPAAS
jgi:hypothetical protein